MPPVTREMRCPGPCGQVLGRATVRRHGRHGCPGQDRQRVRLLHAVNRALNPAADLPPELLHHCGWRHYHRRDPPPPPILPQRQRRTPPPPPAPDAHAAPDGDGDFPMGSSDPQPDAEDARLRQPDFANDTPGAGPSGHATPPDSAPPPAHEPDDTPPTTLADANEPWLRGLSAEDIVSQELRLRSPAKEDDVLTVQAFNYKVTTDITGRAFEKLPHAFPTRLGDLPSEA
ncbi:hypothetical protein FRC06_010063, partial [Ceratobasidium sp. 370]